MQVSAIPLAYNTVYLVESGGTRVLVDAGPDYAGAWDTLQEQLGDRKPDLVICTHGHLDHAGMGARWQREGVPVAAGAADLPLYRAPQLATDEEFSRYVDYARSTGAPDNVLSGVITTLEQRRRQARRAVSGDHPPATNGSRWPTGLHFEPFQPDVRIAGDHVVEGTSLQVVLCPGHTPGNLVVVEPERGWLFSGDQLLPDITPTPGIQFEDSGRRFPSLPAFATSLRRLREFECVRCFPGHGATFDDVRGTIDDNLRQIEQRTERVREAIQSQGFESVYGLAQRLYPRALRRRFWQIIATVQGHLDMLRE